MNLKKKMKGFFTLTRKANGGFTLVELIVVIAILAILAGVAVPAYSGYVTQANKQADITLVKDIEYALTLASYNGTFKDGDGGVLPLSTDPIAEDAEIDENLEKALVAAFGSNYRNTLKLKYAGWGNNGLALGLTGEMAKQVYDSTYYASSDKLMEQVTEITGAAWTLLGKDSNSKEIMVEMFNGDMSLEQAAQDFGYESLDKVPADALPNLMVMAVANDVMLNQNEEGHEMSEATELIQGFALYNGYAATAAGQTPGADGKSFADHYDTFVAAISGAEDVDAVADAYRALQAAANANTGYGTYAGSSQKDTDFAAFSAMMSGLAGAGMTNSEDVAAGLGQADFFTNGLGSSLFNTYINAVEAAAGLNADACDELMELADFGGVGVFYTFSNNKISIGNTLPVE